MSSIRPGNESNGFPVGCNHRAVAVIGVGIQMLFITAVNVDGIDLMQRLTTTGYSTTWTRTFWTRRHKRDSFSIREKSRAALVCLTIGDRYRGRLFFPPSLPDRCRANLGCIGLRFYSCLPHKRRASNLVINTVHGPPIQVVTVRVLFLLSR